MIKNIIFDLDDTLFDFSKAERVAVKRTLTELGVNVYENHLNRYSEINLAQWKLLEQGKLTRDEVKVRRYELLFKEFNINKDASQTTAIYENYLSQGHYYLNNAHSVLKDLSKNYSLFIASNGSSAVQHGRISSSDLEDYVKGIFVSQEVGYNKPDKRFFDYLFNKTGINKNETIMVGDSLSSDIQGGANCGIKTVWFNRKKEENNTFVMPNYEINDLSELHGLIASIK